MLAVISGICGIVSLFLAAAGIYGLTAYSVVNRRNEFRIRLALGARGRDIVGMVLRDVLLIICGGLLIGGVCASWGGRLLGSLLYDSRSFDPFIMTVTAVILGVTALSAGLFPALSAGKEDPGASLRVQ